MRIILFSGMPCAGKSTAINLLKEEFPTINVISMGDLVRKEMYEKGLKINMREYGRKIREKDKSYVAKLCIKELKEYINENEDTKDTIFVVDGVRNYEEVEEFRKFCECFLISIHSSPKTRFKRYLLRKRADDVLNFEGFLKRDLEELSWGLGNVIALSDMIIINEDDEANNNSIEKFKENLIKSIKKIIKF